MVRRGCLTGLALVGLCGCAQASAVPASEPVPTATMFAVAEPAPAEPDGDGDGDGIVDSLDECPDDAEVFNGWEDEDGCPDDIPIVCDFDFGGPFAYVGFPGGGVELDADAIETLERTVKVLEQFSEVRLEISGHTDNRGALEANAALSLRRAEVVRDYLVSRGLDPARFTTVGRGADMPIESNETAEGRAHNRRVEFQISNR